MMFLDEVENLMESFVILIEDNNTLIVLMVTPCKCVINGGHHTKTNHHRS